MPRKTRHPGDAHARVANPELARAMHGLRSSSAAQPHTPKPRKGSRSSRRRAAIADQPSG